MTLTSFWLEIFPGVRCSKLIQLLNATSGGMAVGLAGGGCGVSRGTGVADDTHAGSSAAGSKQNRIHNRQEAGLFIGLINAEFIIA
jgi:hypothetical protein